jgi:hypothetical protein
MKHLSVAAFLLASTSVCHAGAILKATHGESHNLQPRAMDIAAQVDGAFAKTTVTVIYSNANQSDIEADFLYSAPKGAIVTGFAYWCGKERVEARIVDRERATQIYAAATSVGASPALVELKGKNVFRARIRPIKARQDLRVELRLAAPLEREAGALAWNYPIESDTRDVTLDWLRVHVSGDKNAKMISNMDAPVSDGETWLRQYNCKPDSNLHVAWPSPEAPLEAKLSAEHVLDAQGHPTPDGYFALDLKSKDNAPGDPQIAGIGVSDVVIDHLAPGTARVLGRYTGSGNATISWGKEKTLVWFPRPPVGEQREVSDLARSLWGARRIEQLSLDPKNAPRVQLLSHRLGLPSKWTSWLALSGEERQKYNDELRRVDLQNRAAAFARTVAMGIESNRPYSPESLQARAGLRAIERSSFGRKIAFQEEEARHNGLRLRMKELAKIVVSRRLGLTQPGERDAPDRLKRLAGVGYEDEDDFLDNAQKGLRFKQIKVLKAQYTQQVCALHGSEPATQKLAKRIDALQNRYDIEDDDFKSQAQLLATQGVAKAVLAEALQGREDGEHAARLWDTGERFAREHGQASFDSTYYRPQIQASLDEQNQVLLEELEAGRDDAPEAQAAKREIQQLYTLAPGLRASLRTVGSREWRLDLAWRARAHETAYRLAQARRDRPTEAEEIEALQTKLDSQSNQTEHDASDFQQVEDKRLANNEPLETARQYRLRPGDPLISLGAPKDARSVVAVLPDGTIQPLAWNSAGAKWEARFDVPTYARDGSYVVQVLVALADGKRQSFSMPFSVDTVKPRALGEVGGDGGSWNLKILSDARTDRVTALLPWGRKELYSLSGGLFAAHVAVPKAWQGRAAKVHFIVTDKAHNRTEIAVDWS